MSRAALILLVLLTGCSSGTKDAAEAMASVMQACAKPASVTMKITEWGNQTIDVHCPELKPGSKLERAKP